MEKDKTKALLKKVRKLEIKTRGLSNQLFSGEYHSAFKGRGMTFSEVRDYQPGDDIRTIDWNVTARFNKPFIKVFEEEREMTVMLLVDLSASGNFGTQEQFKNELIAEISAVIAFSAIQNNDKVGAILFTDRIEKFIPPKKGKSHILQIIRELISFEPAGKGTDIKLALEYLSSIIKRKSTCFMLSDFKDKLFETALKVANRKHDLIGLHVYDPAEEQLGKLGIVPLQDLETGKVVWQHTGSKSFQRNYKAQQLKAKDQLNQTMKRAGVDMAHISTAESYIKPIMNLFKYRESKR
ncbi:MAG: hypothetical protein ACI8ZO_000522 [Flavobacteriales bacterium]|jgi:uncharacterized protein (DUF58 family)